jgi:hypothetical protein
MYCTVCHRLGRCRIWTRGWSLLCYQWAKNIFKLSIYATFSWNIVPLIAVGSSQCHSLHSQVLHVSLVAGYAEWNHGHSLNKEHEIMRNCQHMENDITLRNVFIPRNQGKQTQTGEITTYFHGNKGTWVQVYTVKRCENIWIQWSMHIWISTCPYLYMET